MRSLRTFHLPLAALLWVEARLGLVTALFEFAVDAVLNARSLELQHVPGVQRRDAILDQRVAVALGVADR